MLWKVIPIIAASTPTFATTEKTITHNIVGIARMKDKPNFIVFDKCLLERFWAAKKDKNNAINDPIIVVRTASEIVTARLWNIWA